MYCSYTWYLILEGTTKRCPTWSFRCRNRLLPSLLPVEMRLFFRANGCFFYECTDTPEMASCSQHERSSFAGTREPTTRYYYRALAAIGLRRMVYSMEEGFPEGQK